MNFFERLLGGSPLSVLIRLVVLSLLVGVVMATLGLDPRSLLRYAIDSFEAMFGYGFDALRNAGRYILTGALIVLPIWIVVRLFSVSGRSR